MLAIRNFILIALLGFSLAVVPRPAAAATDDETLARILAGLIAAGVIAKVIDDRKDRKEAKRRKDVRKESNRTHGRFGESYYNDFRRDRPRIHRHQRGHAYGRPDHSYRYGRHGYYKPKYRVSALPKACRLVAINRGDRFPVYSSYCLNRMYRHADRLPKRCESLMQTRFGVNRVYGERCLRRAGFRVGR